MDRSQIDGRRKVTEIHRASDGQVVTVTYMVTASVNPSDRLTDRATRIAADLNARAGS